MKGKGEPQSAINAIMQEVEHSGISCQLVDAVQRNVNGTTVCTMVFDKYYARVSNRVSVTLVITSRGDDIFADIISAGGGQGTFFRFSWGAEESFVEQVAHILQQHGLVVSNI